VANAIVIAIALQVGVTFLPSPTNVFIQFAFVIIGILIIGLGSGLYLTTRMGPGPRDGWMTGIHLRTGWPVSAVRLGIEVVVLTAGWLLGGTVGIGTVMFAILIGPSVGYGLMFAGAVGRDPNAESPVEEDPDFPELDA
ncbi:MAG: YczE/YyaS/YitT family protein, partial [Candidatus Nanopelagicales bacterium]